jgi:hypothetical protein
MRRTVRQLILLCLVSTLCVSFAASARERSAREDTVRAPHGPAPEVANDNNGVGIGPGGVPELRDRLEIAIAENAAAIAQNAAAIGDNAAAIAQNTAAIGDNAAAIAQNAIAIAQNAIAIAENEAAIEQLQDELQEERERIDQLEEDLFVDNDDDGVNELAGDCDDTDDQVSPLLDEVPANMIDDDCDLLIDEDDGPAAPGA